MIFICGSPWGIGTYRYLDGKGEEQVEYGYYNGENPNNFFPDLECCTEKEIAAHKAACEEWNKND